MCWGGGACSKCGFCIIIPEGIIELHLIIMLLVKCHEKTCCHGSAWGDV